MAGSNRAKLQMPPWGLFRGVRRPPNMAQMQALVSPAPFVGFCGGVGSGKTHWLVREGIRRALRNGPGQCYLVVAPSYKVLKTSTWDHFERFLMQYAQTNGRPLHTKMRTSPQNMSIELRGGVTFQFLTGKNPNSIIGQTVSGFLIDEAAFLPQGMAIWNACLERLRAADAQQLFGLWASSPHGPVGIPQFFVERTAAGDPDYDMVFSRTEENRANLPQGYIERQMVGKSDRQIRQQLHAEILDYEGAVYAGEFDNRHSLAQGWSTKRDIKNRDLYLAIDWGPRYPHVLWICNDPDEDFDVVFDEFCEEGVPHRELIERVHEQGKRKWGLDWNDYERVYGDCNPARARRYALRFFGQRDLGYESHEIPPGGVVDGIDVVASRLRDHEGARRLLFAPELERTKSRRRILQCMRLYQWRSREASGDAFVDDTLQPLKNNFDHGPDALRYYIQPRYRWRYFDAAKNEKQHQYGAAQ
jgi:hypothetical protein